MSSVVAVKSRAFSSFSCSANEQVCRSQDGAQTGSQPRLANGNIPYHIYHAAHSINGGWLGGGSHQLFLVSMSFKSSLGQEFELFFPGCKLVVVW